MPISTFCPDGKHHSMHQPRCPICTIEALNAELENRKKQFDDYADAEEINNAEMQKEIEDMHYETGIMSAITGRQDNETLTEAVTRVCHQLAAFNAACNHVADLYGEDSERGLAAAEILRYQRNSKRG